MNKILSVAVVLIVFVVIYLLRNDVVDVETQAVSTQVEVPETEKTMDSTQFSDVAVVINETVFIKNNNQTDVEVKITDSQIKNYGTCIDIMDCESVVVSQMKNRFGLSDFVYSPTNDMNKARLFNAGKEKSDFVKIGNSGSRDVYAFETTGYFGERFVKELDLNNNQFKLLNDEYLIFYDDEITIKFDASNDMQNMVFYTINSKMYEKEFSYSRHEHINKMPMCEGKKINMKLDGNKIVPVVPNCDGVLAKQTDMLKINDSALIDCIFPNFAMPDEVYINPDQILYLGCDAEKISNIDSKVTFDYLQAIKFDGEITDYSFLNKLTSLSVLEISAAGELNLNEIGSLENLTSLSIAGSLGDSSWLANMPFLQYLSINNSTVESYDFLLFLDKLKSLNLDTQKLEKLPDLSGNAGLISLSMVNNNLNDLDGVELLYELKYLNFKKNKVKNLEKLNFNEANYDFVDGRLNPIDCTTFNGVKSKTINIMCK
ncbi:MAG: hypothetical protein HRU38_05870 [Saccharospirillaceae bacterium]|nr:hypothetical protein [Pseudomonadales bacterium]NRB78184.1 hypothetical protein [Saccharospirillaceae bacterium]